MQVHDDDDIEVLMERLSPLEQMFVLARTWEAIEVMMLDEKTRARMQAARKARS
jgi:hypothetical protein